MRFLECLRACLEDCVFGVGTSACWVELRRIVYRVGFQLDIYIHVYIYTSSQKPKPHVQKKVKKKKKKNVT